MKGGQKGHIGQAISKFNFGHKARGIVQELLIEVCRALVAIGLVLAIQKVSL